ncbi:hypothetical protein MXD59_19060 [Frankia sp. Ag45/Mut15]|uniref:Uncharacterized protein n=1 Tax=Frankia umida TaxID=573489 RepID=A0ABT0K231_9ACTN|nr:hypothetical protein [Frankia umida]MCK9877850.1 hypothetical protein [Frankia umida]
MSTPDRHGTPDHARRPTLVDLSGPAVPADLGDLARRALARHSAGIPADTLIAALAHQGVVAIRTHHGLVEVRELVDGWTLVKAVGTPDLTILAAAARLRAVRLARHRARSPDSPM